MAYILYFDVLAIIIKHDRYLIIKHNRYRFLKHDRYLRKVIKLFKHPVVTLAIFVGCKLFKSIYMAVLMAEDKSRCNDINTSLYETDASKP